MSTNEPGHIKVNSSCLHGCAAIEQRDSVFASLDNAASQKRCLTSTGYIRAA